MPPTRFKKNERDLPAVTPDKPFDVILKVSNGSSIPQNQQMPSGFDKNSSDKPSQKRIETPDPSTILKDVIRNKIGAKQYGKYTESLKKYQDLDVRARNQEKRISDIDAEISNKPKKSRRRRGYHQHEELYRSIKQQKHHRICDGVFLFGAPSGIRTRDPLIKSQLLYQLS